MSFIPAPEQSAHCGLSRLSSLKLRDGSSSAYETEHYAEIGIVCTSRGCGTSDHQPPVFSTGRQIWEKGGVGKVF